MFRKPGRELTERQISEARVLSGPVGTAAPVDLNYRLASSPGAGATQADVNRVPSGLSGYLGWLLIDAFTVDCEARLVSSILGATATWSDVTDYAHSLGNTVLWITAPVLNVKWFGAYGAATDDTLALQRALAQAAKIGYSTNIGAMVYVPAGVYDTNTQLIIPNLVGMFGDGYNSRIRARTGYTPASLLRIEQSGGVGSKYGAVRDLHLQCAQLAAIGLDVEIAVNREFRNIQVTNPTFAGLRLDATQNCEFESVTVIGATSGAMMDYALLVLNSASSNKFLGFQGTNYVLRGVSIEWDNTTSGWDFTPSNLAQHNNFDTCIWESPLAGCDYTGLVKQGVNNKFDTCLFGGGSGSDICSVNTVRVYADAKNTEFSHCGFTKSTLPTVQNNGPMTVFDSSYWSGHSSGDTILSISARTIVRDPGGLVANQDGRISVISGGYKQLWYEGPKIAGTDSERPNIGQAGYIFYYNTERRHHEVYDPNIPGWVSANRRLSFGAPQNLTISGGAITIDQSYINVDTEGGASSDDLDTINGGFAGNVIVLKAANDAHTVVVKHGTGNILLSGGVDVALDTNVNKLMLLYDGSSWIELPNDYDDSEPWTDYTASSTITGWGGSETGNIEYSRNKKRVYVNVRLSGPASGTTVSFTLPYSEGHASNPIDTILVTDASSRAIGYFSMSGSTVTCYPDAAGSAWTASGTRAIFFQFWYEMP
jgi:hypothetical protein